ncbi:MAG: UDP-N-acetylglucosamine 2-epimerase (non-hydrolyzing) [Puniceicoccales bacterium]|jgi:UDP-N-acetylglucosamine 2-epimerase|nr:UDP-N-acetylglucosamine 2-epimerase (non-hydrolyzing) [Puniceicoccales bacterium]
MRKPVIIVAGTRPECVKMAPLYFALRESATLAPVFLATGQHRQMLDQTLTAVGITPDYDLNLMAPDQTLADLTVRALWAIGDFLARRAAGDPVPPAAVLVQGDTTTVLAAALAAFYANIPVGHVEAGLRTGNMRSPFPEEMNRRLTAPLARWHFCPTPLARENLLREGIAPAACHVTGNTGIDALLRVRERLAARDASLGAPAAAAAQLAARCQIPAAFAERYLAAAGGAAATGAGASPWLLVTGHRRESFGSGFENICRAILRLVESYPELGVLYPVHLNPRVQEPVRRLLGGHPRIALVPPAAYEDFIWLLDRCRFALSDSGGVQEEAPSLGKPVLVLRETTERPEGVAAGTCELVGADADKIVAAAGALLDDPAEYARRAALKNPYGDGAAAARIRAILERDLAA